MERFEDELKHALRRKEPPEGFTGRVLSAAAARPAERTHAWTFREFFRRPVLRWACVAVALVAMVAGSRYHARQVAERAKAERAKQELVLALKITGDKLQFVRAKVLETGGIQLRHAELRN